MFDGFSCSRARYAARRRAGVRPCWCGRHSDWRHQGRGTRRSDLLGCSLVCSRKSLSAAPMKMRQGACHARRSCATGPSESAVVQAASRAAASLATYRARRSSGTPMSRTPPALRPRPRRPWLVPPQAHALAGRFRANRCHIRNVQRDGFGAGTRQQTHSIAELRTRRGPLRERGGVTTTDVQCGDIVSRRSS
jgi:hypothetical protein